MEAYIKNFAKRENCIAGVCDAAPLALDTSRFTPFVSRDHIKRTNPAASLPGAKSIIVVGVPYTTHNFPPMPEGAGVLSVLGTADDYHVILKSLLKKLVAELQLHANFMCKILVDSPTLDERALAVRAGLGFIGCNGLVISPEYGSRFNIGLLLTDMPLVSKAVAKLHSIYRCEERSDEAIQQASPSSDSGFLRCVSSDGLQYFSNNSNSDNVVCPPNCRKCINACPTGALSVPGNFDAARCISYLTQKENLTPEESALIGSHLYGCDTCQDACPFNNPQPTAWANPKHWLSMNDDDFANTYGHTAMMWRGAALLRRNANIVIKRGE